MFKTIVWPVMGAVLCICFPPLVLVFFPALAAQLGFTGARKVHDQRLINNYHAHQAQVARDKALLSLRG